MNIDKETIEKAFSMLNSPEGTELKNKLQNMDKKAVLELLNKLNNDQYDLNILVEKIKNAISNNK